MHLGRAGIEALVGRAGRMTAVFAVDDMIVLGALSWLYEHRIAVPEQISVIGVSDYPSAEFACPPLTTVRVPYKEQGYEAARQVHRRCRGLQTHLKDSVMDRLIPELVVRKSTARPGRAS